MKKRMLTRMSTVLMCLCLLICLMPVKTYAEEVTDTITMPVWIAVDSDETDYVVSEFNATFTPTTPITIEEGVKSVCLMTVHGNTVVNGVEIGQK